MLQPRKQPLLQKKLLELRTESERPCPIAHKLNESHRHQGLSPEPCRDGIPCLAPRTSQTLHSSPAPCFNHRASATTPGHRQRLPKQPAALPVLLPRTQEMGSHRGVKPSPPSVPMAKGRAAEPHTAAFAGLASSQSRVTHSQPPVRLNQPENICAEQQELRREGSLPRRC